MSKDTNKDPKFHTNQSVWFMHENKAINLQIDSIAILSPRAYKDNSSVQDVKYGFIQNKSYKKSEDVWIENIPESAVFSSKEELIASL